MLTITVRTDNNVTLGLKLENAEHVQKFAEFVGTLDKVIVTCTETKETPDFGPVKTTSKAPASVFAKLIK
jgi:hypothetical protein